MIILHCMNKKRYQEIQHDSYYVSDSFNKEGFIHCSTWNSFYDVSLSFMKDESEKVLLCIDSNRLQAPCRWESFDGDGIDYPHIYGALNMDSVVDVVPFVYEHNVWKKSSCTHVLMNHSRVDEDWCYPCLSLDIHKEDQVCVVAFSFFEDTENIDMWNKQYRKPDGMWYSANTDVWKRFGIEEKQVTWVNYFEDTQESAKNKILNSSVVFFPGGAPDLMMKRIREFHLEEVLQRYQGVMIGYSAGAMIQLENYHITPDSDYAIFTYEQGLPLLKEFDIEVHYEESEVQRQAIQKVMEEHQYDVYAMYDDGGLIIKDNVVSIIGHVQVFHSNYGK